MAKSKSFLDMADVENPVAQFISTVSPAEEKKREEKVSSPVSERKTTVTRKPEDHPSNRITAPEFDHSYPVSGRTYKKAELKTRRVQLLLKQSVYDKIMRVSDDIGVSMNEFIHMLVENYKEK